MIHVLLFQNGEHTLRPHVHQWAPVFIKETSRKEYQLPQLTLW